MFLFPILAIALLFSLSIFVHELGHFLAARALGMAADVFSIGMGPALWKRKFGATVWKIGAIPFGGYVALPQMDPNCSRREGGRDRDRRQGQGRVQWRGLNPEPRTPNPAFSRGCRRGRRSSCPSRERRGTSSLPSCWPRWCGSPASPRRCRNEAPSSDLSKRTARRPPRGWRRGMKSRRSTGVRSLRGSNWRKGSRWRRPMP